jgi:hypothetical protein
VAIVRSDRVFTYQTETLSSNRSGAAHSPARFSHSTSGDGHRERRGREAWLHDVHAQTAMGDSGGGVANRSAARLGRGLHTAGCAARLVPLRLVLLNVRPCFHLSHTIFQQHSTRSRALARSLRSLRFEDGHPQGMPPGGPSRRRPGTRREECLDAGTPSRSWENSGGGAANRSAARQCRGLHAPIVQPEVLFPDCKSWQLPQAGPRGWSPLTVRPRVHISHRIAQQHSTWTCAAADESSRILRTKCEGAPG